MPPFQSSEQQQERLLSNGGGGNRHGGQFWVELASDDAIIEADDRQILWDCVVQVSGRLVHANRQDVTATHNSRKK